MRPFAEACSVLTPALLRRRASTAVRRQNLSVDAAQLQACLQAVQAIKYEQEAGVWCVRRLLRHVPHARLGECPRCAAGVRSRGRGCVHCAVRSRPALCTECPASERWP